MRSGGHLIVECLKAQGVDRVFCVPGESYLDVLDGLHGAGIDVVNARHEGGAAMMAEADGKITGRPGVCMVTRGPGAANASAGVHVARQDSTPMVLFIGQVERAHRGREAFQEVDLPAFFAPLAKHAEEIESAGDIPAALARAWRTAMEGRPGPVVLSLPEDMLVERTDAAPAARVTPDIPAPNADDMRAFADMAARAKRPLAVLGGSRWTAGDADKARAFAETWTWPMAVSFRRQRLFSAGHTHYAGDVGLGVNPALRARIENSDLLLLLGGRFGEIPSQGYALLNIPEPAQPPAQNIVHVHPCADELNKVFRPALAVHAAPGAFLDAALKLDAPARSADEAHAAHNEYLAWTETPPAGKGRVTMSHVISHLRDALPADAVLCSGAGNYAVWAQRFFRHRDFCAQLAPVSGSMGYGLPAAIAAALRTPEREIVCLAGDGCFQMTQAEFAAAAERGLKITVLVCDNAAYGTIRMHQEHAYPGRVSATNLVNPDFAVWAQSFGAHGAAVENDKDFAQAFAAAREAARTGPGPALVHLKLDVRDIAPGKTLDSPPN